MRIESSKKKIRHNVSKTIKKLKKLKIFTEDQIKEIDKDFKEYLDEVSKSNDK